MINHESIRAVDSARIAPHMLRPLYDSYCFSRIPHTVVGLLTGEPTPGLPRDVLPGLPEQVDKVILLFVDAFGWRFFERYTRYYPFLKRFDTHGVVSKLTTQFPSTTAVHTTTIHTGLTVGESGVIEWFYYEPLVDRIITPLLFSFQTDRERNTLAQAGIQPQQIYPTTSIYQQLAAHGVPAKVYGHMAYTPSPFGDAVMQGATLVPYRTITEAMVRLTDDVINDQGKGYYYLYFDAIDAMGHLYGPSSRHWDAEVDTFLNALEAVLHGTLDGRAKNTLLLVTADHGQIEVSPAYITYLNTLPRSVMPFVCKNSAGTPLIPAGSARDMFLYIDKRHLDEAENTLRQQLADRADVYRTDALIAMGMFGPVISDAFRRRAGNLMVLPHPYEQVWIQEKDRGEKIFRGHHGGATPQEMETILLALAYD
jgi:predicted AlkP superfamily pyrophosphatase or phosphodiesterase